MFRPADAAVSNADAPKVPCAAPELLPLVDASFTGVDGAAAAAAELYKRACRSCPIGAQCHDYAVTHSENGGWAGTTSTARARLRKNGSTA